MEKILSQMKKWIGGVHMRPMTYERQGIKPKMDWFAMLVFTTLTLCVLGMISYYVYVRINTATLFAVPSDASGTQVTIDEKLLKQVIDTLDTRASLQASQASTTPPDPSL